MRFNFVLPHKLKKIGEKNVLEIDMLNSPLPPALEDSEATFEQIVLLLRKFRKLDLIIIKERRIREYNERQTRMLLEVAHFAPKLHIPREQIAPLSFDLAEDWAKFLRGIERLFTRDPIGAYVELIRERRWAQIEAERGPNLRYRAIIERYVALLSRLINMLEGLELIQLAKPFLDGYRVGDRSLYRRIFRPSVRPNFMFTKLLAQYPQGEEIDSYRVGDAEVTLFKIPGQVRIFYHLLPPEFTLSEVEYEIVESIRERLEGYYPKTAEIIKPELVRDAVFNIALEMVKEEAKSRGLKLDAEKLARIIVRETVGFGVLELLLQDEKVQDISINAPYVNPVFVYHADAEDCESNIYISHEEAEAWAARLRLLSGRPLDESNPVLDTELEFENIRARVAAITRPLSPFGLSFSIRRHRAKPWTLPLFIKVKMLNPLAAGLISFLVDGARTMLVAGTRGAGKCVAPETVVFDGNGNAVKIKDLVDPIIERYGTKISDGYVAVPVDVYVYALDENLKLRKSYVKAVYKRKAEKLIEIRTRTGRKIRVTPEHIFFVLEDGKIVEKRADELRKGDRIASLRKLPETNSVEFFVPGGDFIEVKTERSSASLPNRINEELGYLLGLIAGDGHVDEFEVAFFNRSKELRGYVKDSFEKLFGKKAREVFPKRRVPLVTVTSKALAKGFAEVYGFDVGKKEKFNVAFKFLNAKRDAMVAFLRGLFDSDGGANRREVYFSTSSKHLAETVQLMLLRLGIVSFLREKEVNGRKHYELTIWGKDVIKFAEKIGFSDRRKAEKLKKVIEKVKGTGTNYDTYPVGKLLAELNELLNLKVGARIWGNLEKYNPTRERIEKIIELAKEKLEFRKKIEDAIKYFETYIKEVEASRKLIESGRKPRKIPKQSLKRYLRGEIKNLDPEIVGKLYGEKFKTSRSMVCRLLKEIFSKIHVRYGERLRFKLYTLDYIIKGAKKIETRTLRRYVEFLKYYMSKIERAASIVKFLETLVGSHILWDEVKEVKESKGGWVYDLETSYGNFVANSLVAHNTSLLQSIMVEIMRRYRIITVEDTLELPVSYLMKLGYNIQPMKVRSPIIPVESELSAEQGLRTSLRLGDSALIIGEVRSKEALALYEAMRVGALANVVAGTIHGDSPYGVYDRVVNDLGVPKTSFKATDIIIIANPIRSADGLHRYRRVIQITEVRKHWEEDPIREKGFVDLMKYDAKKDELVPTPVLLDGESEIISAIASRVREWVGNFDAVWANIELRAKVKARLVEIAEATGRLDLLEADFVVKANDMFHLISEEVKEELGEAVPEEIYLRWDRWLRSQLRK